jgi:hypothetical protein
MSLTSAPATSLRFKFAGRTVFYSPSDGRPLQAENFRTFNPSLLCRTRGRPRRSLSRSLEPAALASTLPIRRTQTE